MKNISDYDFSRISAFIDGELDAKEINCLIADMQTKPESVSYTHLTLPTKA